MIIIQENEVTGLTAPITAEEFALQPIQDEQGIARYVIDVFGDIHIGVHTLRLRTDAERQQMPEFAAWINAQADAVDAAISMIQLRNLLAPQIAAIETADVDNFVSLFPEWRIGEVLAADDRRQYQGVVWRVVQAHTTQADWPPDLVPALWLRVNPPDVIPPWVQPQGSFDAYQVGDKVTHADQSWISIAANNVWEPGVYGWNSYIPPSE